MFDDDFSAPPTLVDDPIRVLLCDDHDLARRSLLTPIEDQPDIVVVAEAADGRSALVDAVHQAPDVVLLDLGLPDVDALAALQLLSDVLPETTVVALVVDEGLDHQLDALRAGARAVAVKERVSGSLADVVRRVHRGEPILPGPLAGLLADRFDKLLVAAGSDAPPLREQERAALEAMARSANGDGAGAVQGSAREGRAVVDVLLRLRAVDPPTLPAELDELVGRLR